MHESIQEGSVREETEHKSEQVPLERPIDDPEVLEARRVRVDQIKSMLRSLSETQRADDAARAGVRERLGLAPSEQHAESHSAREALEQTLAQAEANYPGDWTEVLYQRLLHPSSQEKMLAVYEEHKSSFKAGIPGVLDKPAHHVEYQEQHARQFQERISALFSMTEIGPAEAFNKPRGALGRSHREGRTYEERFTHPGTVFTDGTRNGETISIRQKNIIEAHEKGHAVREFVGEPAKEITTSFDVHILDSGGKPGYHKDADELIERMAQLKNYFGFSDDETFTRAHLEYARIHYIKDTGLDNSMTIFFSAITPAKEEAFLRTMNKYPI